jgi:hypothetical protein
MNALAKLIAAIAALIAALALAWIAVKGVDVRHTVYAGNYRVDDSFLIHIDHR